MIKKKRRREGARAEINVTSLVDVAFTLLIVFIIVAPAMQSGVAVDLPRADGPTLTPKQESLTLTIRASGQVHVGEDSVPAPDLRKRLGGRTGAEPESIPVFIRADRTVAYENVMQVMTDITRLGYTKINLVTMRKD